MELANWLWFWCTRLDAQMTARVSQMWTRLFWFDAAMIVVAKYTPIVMLVVIFLAASGIVPLKGSSPDAIWSGGSAIVSAVLIRVLHEPLSRLTARPRPFDTEPFQPLLTHTAGDSFPSNHAGGAFALACGALHLHSIHEMLLVMAACLCISRIYCGLHHFSDILVGAVGGAAAGLICAYIEGALHLAYKGGKL